jgi:TonB family protein
VPPVYPEIAKRMHITGEVELQVTVDPQGKVKDVKPVSGNHVLSSAAEDAVRQWKYVTVTINFALTE